MKNEENEFIRVHGNTTKKYEEDNEIARKKDDMDNCTRCGIDIPASGGLTWEIGKLSLCYDCYLEFPKGDL